MTKEQLFLAIGAADPELLERSDSRRTTPMLVKWGVLAACLALICMGGLLMTRPKPPAPTPDDNEVLSFTGGDTGVLHLAAICYEEAETENFSIYVNEESYYGVWEDGSYVIRPITPTPEGLPECDLTITHWRNTSLWETAELVQAKMEEVYSTVVPPRQKEADRVTLSAYNGTEYGAEWDAANARVTIIDDKEGGVYTLTARFFTEATEGLGAAFADMANTFQPIPADTAVPAWLESLRVVLDTLLAKDAWVSVYQEDVSDQVSISAVDISPDDDEAPTAAVVSVRHRLTAEEPYNYLTIELSQTDGEWNVQSIDLEH